MVASKVILKTFPTPFIADVYKHSTSSPFLSLYQIVNVASNTFTALKRRIFKLKLFFLSHVVLIVLYVWLGSWIPLGHYTTFWYSKDAALETEGHLKQTQITESDPWWWQEMNLTRCSPTSHGLWLTGGPCCHVKWLGGYPVLPAELSIMVRSEPRFMSSWQDGVQMEKISTLLLWENQGIPLGIFTAMTY